jgi:ribosomal protein L14
MIYKQSNLIPIDSSKIWLTRVFHKYCKNNLISIKLGFFGKCSVKKSKFYSFLKKKKFRFFLLWTLKPVKYLDNTFISQNFNSSVLLKKRLTPKGKIIFGPNTFTLKRKKFIKSFINIL